MLNVKQNFKVIFIILVVAQIIILGVVLCMYLINANEIINGIVRHNKMMSVKYRDLFIELLDKKFFLMLEDIALILKTLNQIDEIKSGSENYGCGRWYLESEEEEEKDSCDFFPKTDTASKIGNLHKSLIEKLFAKYKTWKERNYVNIENIYIVKEKTIYISPVKFTKAAARRLEQEFKDINISEGVTILPPKKNDDLKQQEVCIKDNEYGVCFTFNFLDFNLLKPSMKEYLKPSDISFFILHAENGYPYIDNLKVVFNSNDDSSISSFDLFDAFFQEELEEGYKYLNDNYPEQKETKYNDFVGCLKRIYEGATWKDKIENFIKNQRANEVMEITSSNIIEKSEELYLANNPYKINIIKGPNDIIDCSSEELEYAEDLIFFPLIPGFTYDEEKIKRKEENSKPYQYYILIRHKNRNLSKIKNDYLFVVSVEICLFLFYMVCINLLIWCLFIFLYYYILKGFIFPLKKIQTLYIKILQMACSSTSKENNLALVSQIKLKKKKKSKFATEQKFFSLLSDYQEIVIRKIAELSQIERHEDISKALITLKAICIILEFHDNSIEYESIKPDHDFSKISSFYEAIQYLSGCFFSKYSDKEKIDFLLVRQVCENIFFSMLRKINSVQKIKINSKKSKREKSQENSIIVSGTTEISIYDIEYFYFTVKKAIRRARNELESISKGSTLLKIIEQSREDLFCLSILEENLSYMYSIYKGKLFDEILTNHYLDKKGLGDNIDEEEIKLLSQLKRKELMEQRNDGHKRDKSKSRSEEKEQKKADNKTIKTENRSVLQTFHPDDEIDDDSRVQISLLISNFEEYIELKEKNLIEKKSFSIYHENNFSTPHIHNEAFFDDYISRDRITDLIDILQEISVRLQLSKLYIFIDEEQKGIIEYENALEKIKYFEAQITKYKANAHSKWKTTNFVLLTINTIFYEKLLFIFTMICEKFYQSRNELFINLNILDLSPVYTKSIRKITVVKLLKYLCGKRKELVSNANDSIEIYKNLVTDPFYIELQRSIYKLISIRNSTNEKENIHKKVLFVFDLANNYIKDSVFQEILFHYFKRHAGNGNNDINVKKFSFFYAGFDNKLHLMNIPDLTEEQYAGKDFNKKYLVKIDIANTQGNQNKTKEKGKLSHNQPQSNQNSANSQKELDKEREKCKNFFSFINEYNKGQRNQPNEEKTHRTDKALYHAALFGLYSQETKMYKSLMNYNKNFVLASSKEANYLVMMTNIQAKFTDNSKNWKIMAELMYERKFCVIIIISYDPEIDNLDNQEVQEKLENYKKFVKSELIDGYLFIMRSLTHLKFILNTVFPIGFNEFNSDIVKHYLYSVDNLRRRIRK